METHARYVLIGAFTLAGLMGILGFVLWFASVGIDRQFAYYDVDFDSVSGLSTASAVRFAGFPVGQVVTMALAPDESGKIRVRLEVDAATPVRIGSIATVETQGVTGVGFVGLTAGMPDEPLLRDASPEEVPMIPAGRSALQVLSEDAPLIIEEALEITRQVGDILGEDNQARITAILTNVETSSAELGRAMDDFSEVTETVARASEEIAAFTTRLESISEAATTALQTADETLVQVGDLAERAQETLEIGDAALESGRKAFESADAFVAEQLPGLIEELNGTATSVREQLDLVTADTRALLKEYRNTGTLASQRLTEAQATIEATDAMLARLTETLTSIESASQSVQALAEGDGAALIADLRATVGRADEMIASATTIATEDLPEIVADIRSATEAAARAVEEVSADLSAAAGRVDGLSEQAGIALDSATEVFQAANETLAQLNGAIETGDKALTAADQAFTAADEVLREDVAAITADLRETLDTLNEAVAQVSADLPGITSDLRSTAESATSAFGQFERTITSSSGPIQTFARDGLPQYTRLAKETQTLIATLERLVRNIERDPARYLLGRDEPLYRR